MSQEPESRLYQSIISPEDLYAHHTDAKWAIVDCRFDLKDPAWGERAYRQGHIPGAVYAHLDHDLSGERTQHTGRHPLPPIEAISARLSHWGIDRATQVVVYDQIGGAYAARLWWLLRFLGHYAAAVLDGGLPAWVGAGYPLRDGVETRPPAIFEPAPNWDGLVSTSDVERLRSDPSWLLIDARAPERFRGEVEPIDPVAGHIPGAVNRFHGDNLDAEGRFLSPEILRSQYQELLGEIPPDHAVVYCGSGVTSCHHLVAMEHAGLPLARLYLGSWSEWIRDRSRPVG